MKKVLSTILLFVVVSFTLSIQTKAFTLSPSSGTLNNGGTAVISVLASPSSTSNAVEVHIIIPAGMTVTNFTPATTGPNLGDCTGSVHFLPNEICSALGSSTSLTSGQLLGTFSLTSSTNGTYNLTAGSEAKYSNNQTVTGTLATYTVSASGQSLPTTSIFSNESRLLWFGSFLILLGLTILQIRKSNINFNLAQKFKDISLNRKKKLFEDNQKSFEQKVLKDK